MVLAVVVVVEAALVVVPFLVPVTNSIWEGRQKKIREIGKDKSEVLIYYSFCLFVLKKNTTPLFLKPALVSHETLVSELTGSKQEVRRSPEVKA